MKQLDLRALFAKKSASPGSAPSGGKDCDNSGKDAPTRDVRAVPKRERDGDDNGDNGEHLGKGGELQASPAHSSCRPDAVQQPQPRSQPPQQAQGGSTPLTTDSAELATPAGPAPLVELSAEGFSGPTSMARLLQQGRFDPFYFAGWPRQAAEGNSEAPVPYAFFADVCAEISATGSRLECVKLLTRFFWAVLQRRPEDLLSAVYLAINRQAPAHDGVELGIGDATLIKAVAEVCSLTEKRCRELYQTTGDLAEVAQDNKRKQATLVRPRPLEIAGVQRALFKIATMSGKDVNRRRLDAISTLLRDAKGPEVNFLVRALQGKMRIGLAEPTVLQALGYAFALHHLGEARVTRMSEAALQVYLNKGASGLATIYNQVPSLDIVIPPVVRHGFGVLVRGSPVAEQHRAELSLRPGLPIRPQLAHPTNGITAILNRLEGKKFTCEYKYDGERAQIHFQRGVGFSIYSRNSETHTTKYPDIINMMPSTFDDAVESFVLDSEVVAIDAATGKLQAFQVLQHRGRKNIDLASVTIRVCVFAFDLLLLNGEPLLERTLAQRRELLFATFRTSEEFRFATHLNSDDVEEIQAFLDKSVTDGCEGLMVKTLEVDAGYTPNRRSHCWLKLKKDYMDGVTDTVDLVPIGAFYGKGKRTGVFGGFLLACYDPQQEEFQSICKIGTGFQDAQLEALTEQLAPHAIAAQPKYYHVHSTLAPDVWLNEATVWEVKAADLTISPVHAAGVGLAHDSKGIALRFPRFIQVRADKGPTDATTAAQIADMYKQQALAATAEEMGGGADAFGDD